MATRFTAKPQCPTFQTASFVHDGEWPRARMPKITGMMYATYSATVLNDVTIGMAPDQTIAARLAPMIAQIAGPGVPCFLLTRAKKADHGRPPSRASE